MPKKQRFTTHLPPELVDECRNAVVALYSTSGLSLSALVEEALRREIKRLAKRHNEGNPFPARKREIPIGRPIK